MLSSSSNFRNATSFMNRRNDPAMLTPVTIPINYEADGQAFRTFVENYNDGIKKVGYETEAGMGSEADAIAAAKVLNNLEGHKYMSMLQEVANLQRTCITIELDDLIAFDETNDDLVRRIVSNTNHYLNLFSKVLDELMPTSTATTDMSNMDVIDVIVSHRRARQQAAAEENPNTTNIDETTNTGVPASLLRRYQLYFKASSKLKSVAVREVKANDVGGMVKIKGIITRVSEVRPLLSVGTYSCEKCGWETYQEVKTQAFMPELICHSEACKANGTKGNLILQSRGSRFQKFQEARIQEMTDQVPMGHIPRSISVVFVGDLTRTVNPGDQIILSGIYLPKPYTGFKAIKAGLLTDTYVMAQHVQQLKPRYEKTVEQISDESLMTVEELSRDPNIYDRLSKSIAPEIYGHSDVKKALLLLMVGGVTREMDDGMKIRGDINVCLMGDPGVAKSQLLKYITKIAPRAVYTTGKGSSGVGLTASVTKDPVTSEMVLEGGALVLADNGICCIDEFDKMDETDRTAIHEVMEQQTISISKAGITTTLNARTSILAAANPLYGRYNPKKSPKENINLPPALLSRFDLLFLILDQADLEEDTRLAEHVCQVHRTLQAPLPTSTNAEDLVDADTFRMYVATARTYNPVVPSSLVEYIVGAYVGLRVNDLQQKDTTYTTPRTLLAVLRMSQALARLRFSNIVNQADIDEAMRLMEVSRCSVDVHLARNNNREADPITKILNLIRDLSRSHDESSDSGRVVPMDLIRDTVRGRGFNDDQLQQALIAFDQCNIWSVSPDGTSLRIFN